MPKTALFEVISRIGSNLGIPHHILSSDSLDLFSPFTAADAPGYNVCSDPELNSKMLFDFPSREELIEQGLLEE